MTWIRGKQYMENKKTQVWWVKLLRVLGICDLIAVLALVYTSIKIIFKK